MPEPDFPLAPLSIHGAHCVRFHVMGHPRAETTMGIMDPPKAETFKRTALEMANGDDSDSGLSAFGPKWVLDAPPSDLFNLDDQNKLSDLAAFTGLIGLSVAIDNAINNSALLS